MKILILGAKGNLGGQLINVFAADNEVIAWDREEIDITDKELVSRKINDIKPHIIINAAAYNAVDKCEEDEREFELAKKINGIAPGYLAQAAMLIGATLIHYSTDYVFAGNNESGYKEDDEPDPINKYGETKLMGETAIISSSGRGLKWYIIRTSKLFGPKGESETAKPNFFDIMLKLSKEKDELQVVNDEVSCFTYTFDLAQATKDLLDKNYGYGIYHLVNRDACSWYKAAQNMFRMMDIKIKVKQITSDQFPRPAKRPKYSELINTKAKPLRNWRKALKEYLNI